MERAPVDLEVGGKRFRVVANADEHDVRRLAEFVDHKLRELAGPGRSIHPQGLLLVAIALAHELEDERAKRRELESTYRARLSSMLRRIDAALEGSDEASSPEAARPSHVEP